MCGIIGGAYRNASIDRPALLSALAALRHRGPDAEGIYENGPVFLGHRRLSIIDLDPRANQPLRVGSLVITYNGEIYNYKAVRRDLERLGIIFSTQSDTEVIAAAFRHEGLACLQRFEGMFAFAIWDESNRIFTLARDRFGEKPLLYFQDRERFLFASEIPPLEKLIERSQLEIDPVALRHYFQFSFIPAPYAPYRNMQQLMPGNWLQFDTTSWSIRTGTYYELKYSPRSIHKNEAIAILQQRMAASVKLRLATADVPVATFLSGGIDSSVISALAAGAATSGIHAYSIGFPEDPAFDESPYARMAAERYPHIRHTVIDATENALLDFTDRTLSMLGEPYADASLIPTAFLCAHVSEKVVLGGDAADELFGGYGVYAAMRASARLPGWVKRILSSLPRAENPHALANPVLRALALFQSHMQPTPMEEYLSWRSYASPTQLRDLGMVTGGNAAAIAGNPALETLADILALDIRFNLPNDMLKKVDLASMQHGVEVRLPYLDRQLVEFALSLPEALQIKGTERKYILREAFRGLLPPPILTRRKQGFLLPIRRWFKTGGMRARLLDMVHGHAILDAAALNKLADEHAKGVRDHSVLLWTCYIFLTWHSRRGP